MYKNPKDWTGKCLTCGETFAYPDFECKKQPGKHTVEEKRYFHLGAGHVQSMRDRRLFSPMVNLKADVEVRDKVTGMITRQEGIIIQFENSGLYLTSDPEEQYFLDHKRGVASGAEGQQEWDKMYLTTEQLLVRSNQQLADVQRQIREGNSLLEAVRKQKNPDAVGVR